MPELPEVETIRLNLQSKILDKKIIGIEVFNRKTIQNNLDEFIKKLQGRSFTGIDRRGKLLIFNLNDNKNFLLVHLKMTGRLLYQVENKFFGRYTLINTSNKINPKYDRVKLKFVDNSRFIFNDLRKFGYLRLVDGVQKKNVLSKFGIEPLQPNFTLENFAKIFTHKSSPLKSILLNQELITGLGNIYVDEICFDARVHPQKASNSLEVREIQALKYSCEKIIKKALLNRGTTFSDYLDPEGNKGNFFKFLKVYKKTGTFCPRCKNIKINKIKLAGRSTHFCPNCQI